MIGRVIGTYKIEEKLGEGGMGAVYKGVDTMLDREVAIKALRPELASQTAVVERFRSEAITLAKLHHPNIATLYSLFRQGDELYMVLEYVRGETLDEMMTRRGVLTADEVMPAFCQILDGINHAHTVGIIHRDIKPANIVVTDNGTPKVLDFGIARLLGTNRMTRAGSIIGTLEYMSPEQVKGLETDARSDTYALGMMLYEVLTGRTPFNTDNEFELMKLQTEDMPPNPRSINPNIPPAVEAAIMKAIQKDPDHRFQTAGGFREFLMDAGYVVDGPTRRITGPNQAMAAVTKAMPSDPGIPAPETALATPVTDSPMKATRLGAAAAVALQASPVTADHPSDRSTGPGLSEDQTSETKGSFFDSLTWVHYAGAGSVVVALLALFIIVPVAIFSVNSFSPDTNDNSNKPSNVSNTNSDKKVAVSSTPQPPAPTPAPTISAPIEVTPVETPTPNEPERTAPPERDTPAAPVKKPAQAKKPARPRGGPTARCALTGDC